MKKHLFSLFTLFFALSAYGQTKEENVVRQFGNNLQSWCSTNNIDFRKRAKGQCANECRVRDKIMDYFAAKSNLSLNNFVVNNYLNGFQDAMGTGKLNISISNLRVIPAEEQIYSFSYGTSAYQKEKRYSEEYVAIACEVLVTGTLDYNIKDVYYVREDKILKIDPYKERVDPNTGKTKVEVDFSDLVEEHSLEVSYGYSSNFPLNIGISTNFSYFNIGVEYGMNFSNEQIGFKKHTNYATSTLERGKYWYLMATPGVYLRYASIDCGLGNVFAKYNYNYESVYTSSSSSERKNYFIMKPKVTFHIPIPFGVSPRDEVLYISPHIGYQYIPKCSTLNCWEVGIGIRFRFETY